METQKDNHAWLIFTPLFGLVLVVLNLLTFSFLEIVFFSVAGISIFVYGYWAFEIHGGTDQIKKKDEVVEPRLAYNKWYRYNQYWFNGLGAFMGWLALYLLLFGRIGIGQPYFDLEWFVISMDWQDFALGLVAFFGITGYFPFASLLGKLSGR
jgi:hypothetical protein